MDLAELRQQLLEWLEELKSWEYSTQQSWGDYIFTEAEWLDYMRPTRPEGQLRDSPREGVLHAHFFTDSHEYHIAAHAPSVETPTGYLGAYAFCRKKRAGEQWTRLSDLPDGPLDRKTWDIILKAVLRYELIAKVKAPVVDSP